MRKIRVAAVGNHRDGYIGMIECRERHPSTTEARAHVQALVRDELIADMERLPLLLRRLVHAWDDGLPVGDYIEAVRGYARLATGEPNFVPFTAPTDDELRGKP